MIAAVLPGSRPRDAARSPQHSGSQGFHCDRFRIAVFEARQKPRPGNRDGFSNQFPDNTFRQAAKELGDALLYRADLTGMRSLCHSTCSEASWGMRFLNAQKMRKK